MCVCDEHPEVVDHAETEGLLHPRDRDIEENAAPVLDAVDTQHILSGQKGEKNGGFYFEFVIYTFNEVKSILNIKKIY